MEQIVTPGVFQYLTLSLAPVIILWIGILAIKLSRKTSKNHDKNQDWKL